LSEAEAKRFIAAAGITVPQEYLVQDGAEAAHAAMRIGQPVAIKVVSPDLPHKTEVGGVALDVPAADAGTRVEAMRAAVTARAPDARIDGFLVTPMLRGGVECFVGTSIDPVFGVTVTFGLGGVAVELYRDVTTRIAPIDRAEALDMIASTKGAALLRGYRGRPKADVEAVADAIVKITALACANANRIGTIEINPLLALDEGAGVIALDAVIMIH
jgi:acyl-CoA synthetase (NDP forming)